MDTRDKLRAENQNLKKKKDSLKKFLIGIGVFFVIFVALIVLYIIFVYVPEVELG